MARLRFLAATADPREGQEGIVYGPQHETDFQNEDIDFAYESWRAGKAEVLDTSGLTPDSLTKLGVHEETPPA